MAASAVWRSRPVFITSTFRDMHAERDWLRVHVFPVLEERLRARFHHLETIDLRWGVESASTEQEHERERLVLTVCLREIERSRPFLIGLLGDRYGWRPPQDRLSEAAREAGLDDDLEGKSVTELEILYGVLRNPEQQRRSWFYFRKPLPYAAMPANVAARYSDAYSGEPGAGAHASRLAALKARVTDALPGRVREYAADWDAGQQSVTGLDAWGRQVLDDLWSDLEVETAAFLREAPHTWQEQDRWALDEFIEGRVRGFVGRASVTTDLVALATSAPDEGAPWCACVTAEAGSGKSSLFGHLYKTLRKHEVFVLAHAAGISVRSTQVDWMLRRWIGELATLLGQPDPIDDRATPDDIDQTFSRLLGQAAQSRRVVVLIDAINQFEPTTRANYLTWVPKRWPSNARLVATAIPGTQSAALLQRHGVAETPLPPIDRGEALDIVRGICARYHRTLNPSVETALMDKARHDNTPAFGNPLWLELATEELNLLGGEAFDRADAEGAEGIVRLLRSQVDRMPPNVEGLYGSMLDGAERNFGQAWTRAFVNAIAISRSGWRDSDLERLMPILSGEVWDALRFATLRRGLRAHVIQRGSMGQWDFHHSQVRQSVIDRFPSQSLEAVIHKAIAGHLEALPREDQLRQSELMYHYVGADSRFAAAQYYASELSEPELDAATSTLAGELEQQQQDRDVWVTSLLLEPGLGALATIALCDRFIRAFSEHLRGRAKPSLRLSILRGAIEGLNRTVGNGPAPARVLQALYLAHGHIGDNLIELGKFDDGAREYREALNAKQLLPEDFASSATHSFLLMKIGNALQCAGDARGVAAVKLEARSIATGPMRPTGTGLAARYRSIDELVSGIIRAAPDLSAASNLCQYAEWIGPDQGAELQLRLYDAAASIFIGLLEHDPDNLALNRELAITYGRLGSLHVASGDGTAAVAAFERARNLLARLVALSNAEETLTLDLAAILENLGDSHLLNRSPKEAIAAYGAAAARLDSLPPDVLVPMPNLAVCYGRLGMFLSANHDFDGSMEALSKAAGLWKGIARDDAPVSPVQLHSLVLTHARFSEGLCSISMRFLRGAQETLADAAVAVPKLLGGQEPVGPWEALLTEAHERIVKLAMGQQDLKMALVSARAAASLIEHLAARLPGKPSVRRAAIKLHIRVAVCGVSCGSFGVAARALGRSVGLVLHVLPEKRLGAEERGGPRTGDPMTGPDR